MFELLESNEGKANIKVIGVGGAGGNAINNMIISDLKNVQFIAVNTDAQVLQTSMAEYKLQIGDKITRGLGAGSNPQVGRESALEDNERLREILEGADMVFITAGMGGGTGTGAAPVIAEIARNLGALTVAVVTKPFFYEGRKRLSNATLGIKELNQFVDTTIVIPNDKIQLVVEKGTPLVKSFEIANDVLRDAVQGITDLILVPGLINLDFADVKTIMQYSGKAVMGIGKGKGEQGHIEAAKKAISNPLLEETSIDGARGILINITGGTDLSLDAVQGASELVFDSAHDDADIIFGAVIDPTITGEVKVTVIATGFEDKKEPKMSLPEMSRWKSTERDRVFTRSSDRLLTKNLFDFSKEDKVPTTELMSYDDDIDIPTFIRKQREDKR
ncbi:MAG: cell division protein FtsZ [Candidatus Magnetobacterium sp. LHC-1]|uniref:Cell division protein FtsZ n=1 Tax=Candidatus Magnetobacterium casense TaxID=1455061 RepID=A0ABS6RZ91_9BACT|nr:cell division protein FtsZ [Candidatus Magnetobacterium casensis]MBF0336383.1 cell division protein FtsZ [Nitrospirota bacterium]MBF0607072.1 cell division protein FtsZ [Nitrospirota bacterium]MBV6341972.1 cell division protein FtsZ [Candidatus Magnetobacterium casensis]